MSVFFFKQKTAYEIYQCDWSSDVCSSDLGVFANVDFYSGILYKEMGIPPDQFTSIFAIARSAGWLAHWREQLGDNRIFRPTQVYTGQSERDYVPISER